MRVLVVEDNARMAALLQRGLRENGYAVDVAAGAIDALALATEVGYDAVILDVMLDPAHSGRDGVTVCEELRRTGRTMPVLMLTARDGIGDRVRGLDAGADDYLTKPFHFQELLARLRSVVRRGQPRAHPVLAAGDLRLDPARRQVWRGDTPIGLTAKEFALLEYLLRHVGEVLSRADLIEHVWDFAFDHDSNLVDVHIRNLRRKIDEPFRTRTVETVRGIGYRVRDERLAPSSD
jgi:two-component system, OmpR family, response regulator